MRARAASSSWRPQAGAESIKFQVYTADSLTIRSEKRDFLIESKSLWTGKRLYDLYQEAATPYEWFPELFAHARSLGITPFASPFDLEAVKLLQALDAPAYKIASFEAVDIELIQACARTGKPMIISTGMCDADDIVDALKAARDAGCRDVALLKCTSAYPATAAEANLATIPADGEDVRRAGWHFGSFARNGRVGRGLRARRVPRGEARDRCARTGHGQFRVLAAAGRARRLVEETRMAQAAVGHA